MTVTPITLEGMPFEARYDAEADVMYLRRADKRGPAARTVATEGGHAVRYDADGDLIGLTIVDAQRLVDEHRELDTPDPFDSGELAPALA